MNSKTSQCVLLYILSQATLGYAGYQLFMFSFYHHQEWYGVWLGMLAIIIGCIPYEILIYLNARTKKQRLC